MSNRGQQSVSLTDASDSSWTGRGKYASRCFTGELSKIRFIRFGHDSMNFAVTSQRIRLIRGNLNLKFTFVITVQ